MTAAAHPDTGYLVGAGPDAPGLLTRRAVVVRLKEGDPRLPGEVFAAALVRERFLAASRTYLLRSVG